MKRLRTYITLGMLTLTVPLVLYSLYHTQLSSTNQTQKSNLKLDQATKNDLGSNPIPTPKTQPRKKKTANKKLPQDQSTNNTRSADQTTKNDRDDNRTDTQKDDPVSKKTATQDNHPHTTWGITFLAVGGLLVYFLISKTPQETVNTKHQNLDGNKSINKDPSSNKNQGDGSSGNHRIALNPNGKSLIDGWNMMRFDPENSYDSDSD